MTDQLPVALYLDENVSVLVAKLLRGRGIKVTTANEAGCLGTDDEDQLRYAIANRMVIVTHDVKDFSRLAAHYAELGTFHSGMIMAVRRSPYEIARRLTTVLSKTTAVEMENQVRYI